MPVDTPDPGVREAVVAAMNRWLAAHWALEGPPPGPDTSLEETYGISGDDMWQLLETVQDELSMSFTDDFNGARHFGQEAGLLDFLTRDGPFVALTPRLFASYLRPVTEPTARVVHAIKRWCDLQQIRPSKPVLADLWTEDILHIHGAQTQSMLSSVCEQLAMVLTPEFDPRRHLRQSFWFLRPRPPEPLTPRVLARYLRSA